MDTDEESFDCCVCFFPTDNSTPCRHRVCASCLLGLQRPHCPMCRAELPPEVLGPQCKNQSDSDNSDDDRMPFRRVSGINSVASPTSVHSLGAWRFELPYTDDWRDACRTRLRGLGVTLMDYRQFVTVRDRLGGEVQVATWRPDRSRFPLTFSAPPPEQREATRMARIDG
eukprot:TRINITY_DN23825_c0_g2_i2.p1 TRINITY_DN23825_c0_g2~~TRINITY_DN23825_c0_g2_i2.p1  ORF type:complete len:170 (+),score=7.61 TRINITY_DN23825_c0_g2_i2:211-720(+)